MKKFLLSLLAAGAGLALTPMYAQKLDHGLSGIISPSLHGIVTTQTPIVVGVVRTAKGVPFAHKKVMVFLNDKKMGTVATNKDGVWSYRLNARQRLTNGLYLAQACVQSGSQNSQMTRATAFEVRLNPLKQVITKTVRSGNVSVAQSEISFPYNQAYINTTVPTIAGVLRDAQSNPVAGETVQVKIDTNVVGTVTSDSNGVFSYTLTSPQALTEVSHTVDAHCVETNVDLTSNTFTVDVTAPATPTITAPTESQAVTQSLVNVQGTTEANATITTFMDGDTFGDISYADGSGNWAIEYTLANGSHSVTAQAEDLAFNTGDLSPARSFSVNA